MWLFAAQPLHTTLQALCMQSLASNQSTWLMAASHSVNALNGLPAQSNRKCIMVVLVRAGQFPSHIAGRSTCSPAGMTTACPLEKLNVANCKLGGTTPTCTDVPTAQDDAKKTADVACRRVINRRPCHLCWFQRFNNSDPGCRLDCTTACMRLPSVSMVTVIIIITHFASRMFEQTNIKSTH